jgi:hypothetical protein
MLRLQQIVKPVRTFAKVVNIWKEDETSPHGLELPKSGGFLVLQLNFLFWFDIQVRTDIITYVISSFIH